MGRSCLYLADRNSLCSARFLGSELLFVLGLEKINRCGTVKVDWGWRHLVWIGVIKSKIDWTNYSCLKIPICLTTNAKPAKEARHF